jgi:hypothetical protein
MQREVEKCGSLRPLLRLGLLQHLAVLSVVPPTLRMRSVSPEIRRRFWLFPAFPVGMVPVSTISDGQRFFIASLTNKCR